MRGTVVVLAGVTGLLAISAPASASTIADAAPGTEVAGFVFIADRHESNDVSVSLSADGNHVVVVDRGANLEVGRNCSGGGPPGAAARCRLGGRSFYGMFALLEGGSDGFDSTALPSRIGAADVALSVTVIGDRGNDTILTGASVDEITPGFGADTVLAGGGRDLVRSEAVEDGSDVLDGGDGEDELTYGERHEDLTIDLEPSTEDGERGEADDVLNVETIEGGSGDDRIVGTAAADLLSGGRGDDELLGMAGDDRLFGDAEFRGGDDRVDGGQGSDRLVGEAGRDTLLGRAGPDRIDSASLIYIGFHGPDRARDRVDCGSEGDRAKAEPRDELSACERVRRTR